MTLVCIPAAVVPDVPISFKAPERYERLGITSCKSGTGAISQFQTVFLGRSTPFVEGSLSSIATLFFMPEWSRSAAPQPV